MTHLNRTIANLKEPRCNQLRYSFSFLENDEAKPTRLLIPTTQNFARFHSAKFGEKVCNFSLPQRTDATDKYLSPHERVLRFVAMACRRGHKL